MAAQGRPAGCGNAGMWSGNWVAGSERGFGWLRWLLPAYGFVGHWRLLRIVTGWAEADSRRISFVSFFPHLF
ncbi:hypothetical protein GCM10027456_38310 [Kineosporia babensis]